MNMLILYGVLLSSLWLTFSSGQWPLDASVSSQPLEEKVTELMRSSLRHDDMQNYYDSLAFVKKQVDGQSLLDELSNQISNRFAERVQAIKLLREKVTAQADAQTYKRCCQLVDSDISFDSRFSQKVLKDQFCLRISCNTPANYSVLPDDFRLACIENLNRVPLLKWQYYGTEEGVTSQFPGLPVGDCSDCSFDNRLRPWYVQANIARAQQVVIVIDQSSQIAANFDLAKQVATVLVDSANPRDKIVVVGFNDDITKPVDLDICFKDSLAQAITSNKRTLASFIQQLPRRGKANYTLALEAAFGYFSQSLIADTDAVIAFISSSPPTDSKPAIFQTLVTENSRLENEVFIMTLGIGNSADFDLLHQMAIQDGSSFGIDKSPNIEEGLFAQIVNEDNLRSQMTSYFRHFSQRSNVDEPRWTVPYLDIWGLGVVTSGTLPVYSSSGDITGVVAVDVTLDELLAESTFFRPTESSYSFIIDKFGLIINHPLFPYVDDTQPFFVEATVYERDEEFQQILEKMLRETAGQQTFSATRVLSRGDGRTYGVNTIQVSSSYHWKPIPNTPFIICVVIATEEMQISTPSIVSSPFLYHRFDITQPPQPCSHFDKYYCARNRSSVAFGARSYEIPEEYLLQNEDQESVSTLKNYMEGRGTKPSNLRNEIKDVVSLTYNADTLWSSIDQENKLEQNILFRYIGTREGVFRSFPGAQVPQNFDPVTRPWYVQALGNKGQISFTPAYRDIETAGLVVSLSQVLYVGKSGGSHDASDDVHGVMGIDLLLKQLGDMILDLYPICKQTNIYKCLLVDQGGYTIWSDNLMQSPSLLGQPLPKLEEEIANSLFHAKLLVAQSCAIIDDRSIFHSYRITADTRYNGITNGGTDGFCFNFTLFPIGGMSAFLIVSGEPTASNPGTCNSQSKRCSCLNLAEDKCSNAGVRLEDSCACPCETSNPDYNPCNNTYTIQQGSPYPCIVNSNAPLSQVSQLSLEGLQSCIAGGLLPEPATTTLSGGVIAAIVICGLLSIAFIIAAVIIYKRKKNTPNPTPELEKTPVPYTLPDSSEDYACPNGTVVGIYEDLEPDGRNMMN